MKKTLIIITFLILCPFISFSQIIDDIDIRKIKSEYVEIIISGNPKVIPIEFNYGLGKTKDIKPGWINSSNRTKVIHDGEEVRLLNSIDFIEFFSTWGYENVDENDETFLIGNITQGNGSMIQGNRKTLRFKNNNN